MERGYYYTVDALIEDLQRMKTENGIVGEIKIDFLRPSLKEADDGKILFGKILKLENSGGMLVIRIVETP